MVCLLAGVWHPGARQQPAAFSKILLNAALRSAGERYESPGAHGNGRLARQLVTGAARWREDRFVGRGGGGRVVDPVAHASV
jgi:hypothetical protein